MSAARKIAQRTVPQPRGQVYVAAMTRPNILTMMTDEERCSPPSETEADGAFPTDPLC